MSFLVSIIESIIYTAVYSSSYTYPSRKLFKSIIDLDASPHTHPLRLTIFRATKFLLLDVRGFLRPRPNVELFMRRTEPNSNLVCSSQEKNPTFGLGLRKLHVHAIGFTGISLNWVLNCLTKVKPQLQLNVAKYTIVLSGDTE